MKTRSLIVATALTLCMLPYFVVIAQDSTGSIQPFGTDSFAKVKSGLTGQPFVVSLWSVDCLPCRVELQMLGELKKQDPSFPLVLISTDSIEKRDEAVYILEEYELDGIASWMFADAFIERLRFSIDPTWHGELPRSYFYARDHSYHAHSGILTAEKLREFFPR